METKKKHPAPKMTNDQNRKYKFHRGQQNKWNLDFYIIYSHGDKYLILFSVFSGSDDLLTPKQGERAMNYLKLTETFKYTMIPKEIQPVNYPTYFQLVGLLGREQEPTRETEERSHINYLCDYERESQINSLYSRSPFLCTKGSHNTIRLLFDFTTLSCKVIF